MEDPPKAQNRAIFLDRDGTLMDEMNFCGDPSHVRVIPGAAKSLAELREGGWLNIIVTNQSGIGRGHLTIADYEAVNAELFRQLGGAIYAVYFSPDHPDHATDRRKPGTGMIEEASRDHGCRTILVLTGYGRQYRDCGANFIARDIVEASQIILRETK